MISIATFSELVASLHAGPFEDESWRRFLTLLCECTQTASGVFLCHTHSDGSAQILAGGGLNFSPESYDLYNRHFAARDPYLAPVQRNHRAGVIDGDELLPREQLKETEFFNDLLDRFDLHYSTLLPFAPATGQAESILTLWRGEQQGHMPREYEALLAALIPHLKSAVGIKQALVAAGERALRAEAALDAMPTAAFLLKADGSLAYMNKAAEHLARRQDGIRILRNRLVASDVSRQARLQALISFAAAASGAASVQPGGAVTLPRASSERSLYALVSPLRLANQGQGSPAHVLVLITNAEASAALPREILSVLFGFTSSEVEVANGLLAGLSLEQIAESREVSQGTVRTQLKSLLHKTGTRRQGELIRLLLSLPKTLPMESSRTGL